MQYNPCLVVIFNHKYDKNIEKLEELYNAKFKNIFFLVPFYQGSNPRVIPVYESSFYFQGYIAQGFKFFYKKEFSHYIFIGDDLIINPMLDEHNYAELIGIKKGCSYIPELVTLDGRVRGGNHKNETQPDQSYWAHAIDAVDFYSNRKGSETKNEMPSAELAKDRIEQNGLTITPLNFYNIFGRDKMPHKLSELVATLKRHWTYSVSWRHLKAADGTGRIKLGYPLIYGYSDIVIVSDDVISQFCHLCGVFSAMGLFVEIAIPTALALCSSSIVTDVEAKMKGVALWLDDISALENRYQFNLSNMLTDFPVNQLYFHPIKLSKWR